MVSLNPVVLAFAVVASLLTALLFGLAPAASIRRRDAGCIAERGAGATTGRERHVVRRALVFAEIAMAVMLAAGAGGGAGGSMWSARISDFE
jgi:multidrug efflux pump subunit AcrB